MRYSFHPEAKTEFQRAIDYYEERDKTLGHQFAVEVYATIERVAANPGMWPVIEDGIRRCLVRRFPYGIVYHHDEGNNESVILAVMHLHREPYYWAHRN
jgi:plasmid stabilization system protein ParE